MKSKTLPGKNTAPLWLQDHFLATGHDAATPNATATFIQFEGRQYLCTCKHVVEARNDPDVVKGAKFPDLALHIDRAVLHLSGFGVAGLQCALRVPEAETKTEKVDVAIAPLSDSYWSLLTTRQNKAAVDLDNWREPKWEEIKMAVAAGYPDGHKENRNVDGNSVVSGPLFCACAEVASKLARSEPTIALSSQLKEPHGKFFSGMSGGPIYLVEAEPDTEADDDALRPAAIIFEGHPSRPEKNNGVSRNEGYFDPRHIFFRGVMLTPESFADWLNRAGLRAKTAAVPAPAA